MLYRLWCLIVKELQVIIGNRQGRLLLVMPVVLQTAVFPFAATLEVKNSTLAIYNEDIGPASIELMQRVAAAAAFTTIVPVHSEGALQDLIDRQTVLLALRLPADFSRRLDAGQGATAQILVDGRRSNSGQIASAYLTQIIQSYAEERGAHPTSTLDIRARYNPNINFRWHILPSLVAIITTIGCLSVTALSVAREREEGTFEQLLVSPLTPLYIMAGKAIPGILVAMLQGSFIAMAAVWLYGVPFSGSVLLLLAGMACYGLALAGVGLFISSMSETQQQAFLGAFSFMVPAVVLSGYIAPIENMPLFFRWLAYLNPLSYFIPVLKGVFLKHFGFRQIGLSLLPLLAIALCTLSAALYRFRRHVA